MFGYIKIAKDELRVRELKNYKNFYCGLCKQIANYSQFSRIMLSYDMVFFSLLIEATSPPDTKMCKHTLFRHCRKACGDEKLKYIAAISVILQYYKLQNDYFDGEKKKKYMLHAIHNGYKRASSDFPNIEVRIKTAMDELYSLEKNNCSIFMDLETCFSSIFFDFFANYETMDEYKEIRGRLAYHVAAWVYWFDMYMDIDKDRASGDFNAILLQEDVAEGQQWVWTRLLYHLESAEKMLNLLPYNDNTPILYNIVTLGMPMQMKKNDTAIPEKENDHEVP
jgi:hypothetical protein